MAGSQERTIADLRHQLAEVRRERDDLAKKWAECGKENCFGLEVEGVRSWVAKEAWESAVQRAEAAEKAVQEKHDAWLHAEDRTLAAEAREQAAQDSANWLTLERERLQIKLQAALRALEQIAGFPATSTGALRLRSIAANTLRLFKTSSKTP